MSSQDKNIKPNNSVEADILDLEKKYFAHLQKIFQSQNFKSNMQGVEHWINSNMSNVRAYSKKNKVDLACQRLINFEVMRQLKKIIGVYASPISSDIAFEMQDIILNIDSKTYSELKNNNDFNFLNYGPNQTSFKNSNYGKNGLYPGIPVPCDLPSIDHVSNKPILTYFLQIKYYDNKTKFNWSKNDPNMRLVCVPNGEISRFFNNDITHNPKDYSYEKVKNNNNKLVYNTLPKNHPFPPSAIKIVTGNGANANSGFYTPHNKEVWIYSAKSKPPVYKRPLGLHERRTSLETLDERYDSNLNLWNGVFEWKL